MFLARKFVYIVFLKKSNFKFRFLKNLKCQTSEKIPMLGFEPEPLE